MALPVLPPPVLGQPTKLVLAAGTIRYLSLGTGGVGIFCLLMRQGRAVGRARKQGTVNVETRPGCGCGDVCVCVWMRERLLCVDERESRVDVIGHWGGEPNKCGGDAWASWKVGVCVCVPWPVRAGVPCSRRPTGASVATTGLGAELPR